MNPKLTRRNFIGAAGAGVAVAGAAVGAHAQRRTEDRPPNILFLMTDEHSPHYLSCYGHDIVRTPVLDDLARQGVRFTSAYCQNPICVPSRLSLITGKHPYEIGAWNNSCALDDDEPTIAHAFNEQGYATAALGKMHHVDGKPHGFTLWPTGSKGAYTNFRKPLSEYLKEHKIEKADRNPRSACDADWPAELEPEYVVTEQALKFLDEHRDRPFCVWVSFPKPHFPFIAPRGFEDMYRGKGDLPRVTEQMIANLPKHSVEYRAKYKMGSLTPAHIRLAREKYYSMVTFVDMLYGKVLGKLDELGLRDNTIIVYTSDHGEMLGEHGLWYKNCMFESGAGIPMIVSFPRRLPRAATLDAPVGNIDLFPTLMDLAGHRIPDGLSGSSLVPLMTGKENGSDRVTFADYYAHPLQIPQRMIRTQRWKYWHFIGDDPHLYDMQTDPDEERNLATEPRHRDLVAELRERTLDGWDHQGFQEYQKAKKKAKKT
ncbi:MAG: sulfatase-like hydrolase/transferase [Armatimonadota bacterium]